MFEVEQTGRVVPSRGGAGAIAMEELLQVPSEN